MCREDLALNISSCFATFTKPINSKTMGLRRSNGRTSIEVTVKRTDLIKRLKRNRTKHQQEYEQAITLWQEDLAKTIASTDAAKIRQYPENLSELEENCPVSFLDEYDDIIDMFEMGVNDEILLDSEAFRNFCRDEWDWKSDIAGNKYYKTILPKG